MEDNSRIDSIGSIVYEENPYHIPESVVIVDDQNMQLDEKTVSNHIGGQLVNRILMCCFALCLLWVTTLQVSVAIVSGQILVPTIAAVIDSCSFSYAAIEKERTYYSACVDRQLSVCQAQYTKAYSAEAARVAQTEITNNQIVNNFKTVVSNCSNSFSNAKQSLKAWIDGGVNYAIPFYPNCSYLNRQEVLSLIGSSSSSQKVSIYDSAQQYSTHSDATVSHVSSYTAALTAYNIEYVNNKTKYLHSQVQKMVQDISLSHLIKLNDSLQPVYSIMNDLVACVALGDEKNGSCSLPNTALGLYELYVISTNIWIEAVSSDWYGNVQTKVNDYVSRVNQIAANANSFYESVSGPAGIINWINNNLDLGSIDGSLCGHTSPNWCDFSLVSNIAILFDNFYYFANDTLE